MVIQSPEYFQAIKTRHVEYATLMRGKQTNLLIAMQPQLATLQLKPAASTVAIPDTDLMIEIAKKQNEIADLEFEVLQAVPYKLTSKEAALHYNLGKSHSVRQD